MTRVLRPVVPHHNQTNSFSFLENFLASRPVGVRVKLEDALGERVEHRPKIGRDVERKMQQSCTMARLGVVSAAMLLIAALGVLWWGASEARRASMLQPGSLVPAVTLTTLEGDTIDLRSMRGRTVVLFFAGTDCPTSQAYTGRLQAFREAWREDSVILAAVHGLSDLDAPLGPAGVKLHARITGRSFPTLLDPDGEAYRRLDVRETSTFLVVDPEGVLRYRGPFDNNVDPARATHAYVPHIVQSLARVHANMQPGL